MFEQTLNIPWADWQAVFQGSKPARQEFVGGDFDAGFECFWITGDYDSAKLVMLLRVAQRRSLRRG
jgi:hypothetical protein